MHFNIQTSKPGETLTILAKRDWNLSENSTENKHGKVYNLIMVEVYNLIMGYMRVYCYYRQHIRGY